MAARVSLGLSLVVSTLSLFLMMTTASDSVSSVHHTDRWYFTKDQILDSPSRRQIPREKETSNRQHAALLIQEMGEKLKVYV